MNTKIFLISAALLLTAACSDETKSDGSSEGEGGSGAAADGGGGSTSDGGNGGNPTTSASGGNGGNGGNGGGTTSASGGGGPVDPNMTFFVTSRPVEIGGAPTDGGDLGGVAGADQFCTTLADEALPGNGRTWRAYLSSSAGNARDRIGAGPWTNAAGVTIADDVDDLHDDPPPVANLLTETNSDPLADGMRHDILTGSRPDGTAFANLAELQPYFDFPDGSFSYTNATFDATCADWTSSGTPAEDPATIDNYAVVGHVDWDELGPGVDEARTRSWNASHVTACDAENMALDQGSIRLYCFAAE